MQLGDLLDQRSPLGHCRATRPFAVRLSRRGKRLLHLFVGRGRVLLHHVPGRGIDHCVQTHVTPLTHGFGSRCGGGGGSGGITCVHLSQHLLTSYLSFSGHLCSRLRTQPHPARTDPATAARPGRFRSSRPVGGSAPAIGCRGAARPSARVGDPGRPISQRVRHDTTRALHGLSGAARIVSKPWPPRQLGVRRRQCRRDNAGEVRHGHPCRAGVLTAEICKRKVT